MQRFARYQVKRNDDLGVPDFWNERFQDIDLRLAARENDAANLQAIGDQLISVGISRLNDVFIPMIVEAQSRLNTLGASFSAESTDTKTIAASGDMSFVLTPVTATNYVYTDYVSIRAAAAPENQMLARVQLFDRGKRLLSVSIISAEGNGEFSDWLFRVGTPPETGHATRTDNPHEVTAAQVGAYTTTQADNATNAIATALIAVLAPISNALLKANGLSDLPDKPAARSALGLGALAVLSSAGFGDLASNIWATAATFIGNAANKAITANAVWSAALPVDLGNALSGAVTLDLATGINFKGTLGGSITLADPLNAKDGQCGSFNWTQGSAAGRTVNFGATWYPIDARWPTFSTAANASNYLSWQVVSGAVIFSGGKLNG